MFVLASNPPFKKFIRNHDKIKCSDCKFLKEKKKCIKFGYTDIVTGIVHFDSAYECRFDEKKCGLDAVFFEKETDLKFLYNYEKEKDR